MTTYNKETRQPVIGFDMGGKVKDLIYWRHFLPQILIQCCHRPCDVFRCSSLLLK